MPKKRTSKKNISEVHGVIEGAGEVREQVITDTLELNYMPYAMSVILSRAIPEIDGFKPSHRKLLYSMYKMGLLTSGRTKSANIVGQTMKLNPHGDSAIYDTMVRLSRGYEALLHPYVDSKGNFGKFYSRDMAWAASRYTEASLDKICNELFRDIDKDTVDFVDNYDNTTKEPRLLPVTFPSILVNANNGIAVGMASSICSFNLKEVCETAIAVIKNKNHDVMETLIAPDFAGGGQLVYDRTVLKNIYETGKGSFKVNAVYKYDKKANCIDITQIPPSTSVEVIIEKVIELSRTGKLKEISDIRDETGLEGLKITIDLKRGVDPDKLMARLYKMTPLSDSFSCNFNILVNGTPRVMGVKEIINEWLDFRISCVRRRTAYEHGKKSDRLHLLRGLEKILLDIDKAVAIVRNTEEEVMVVPNLMAGFDIDEIQAEYVAEIKLRHLNREYILGRIAEIENLEKDIADLEAILNSKSRVNTIIVNELKQVIKKYGKDRVTTLIDPDEIEEVSDVVEIPDYNVNIFFTKEGYFKKITMQSLRMNSEQKLKQGDSVIFEAEASNNSELLFFTNMCSCYKARLSDFDQQKASVLGDYIPAKLGIEQGETIVAMVNTKDYSGFMMFCFENGKVAKVNLSSYQTKTNRKKLLNAFSDKCALTAALYFPLEGRLMLQSTDSRILLLPTDEFAAKATKNTQGVIAMSLRKNQTLKKAEVYIDGTLSDEKRYSRGIATIGAVPTEKDAELDQLSLI